MMEWRPFLARVGIAALVGGATLTLAVFVGIRLAAADPPGPTRDALTFAGVLRSPPTTPTPLVFEFTRTGTSPATCVATTSPVTFDSTGAFSIEVPITCPTSGGRAFFNGDPITYTVRLANDAGSPGELLTDGGVAVTPVPYARFADQTGVNNDCPSGYSRATDGATSPGLWFCRRGVDEVVRVGEGSSAFWIDRYEATVWTTREGPSSGAQLFRSENDFNPTRFPPNGQWRGGGIDTPPLPVPAPSAFALSVSGYRPAGWITWFQAMEACRASGKRLPTGSEWLAAANGTDDPGISDGADLRCNTGGEPRLTGQRSRCRSGWGAQDMIGTLWEWTDDWYATPGSASTMTRGAQGGTPWPSGYNSDGTWNVATWTQTGVDGGRILEGTGLPAAAMRGGSGIDRYNAGIFALLLNDAPSRSDSWIGFRCVVVR